MIQICGKWLKYVWKSLNYLTNGLKMWKMTQRFVTLHHEMSRNVPDGLFHVFIFSESKFYAIYNGENHFQIGGLVAELPAFEYGGRTFGTFEKTCFEC